MTPPPQITFTSDITVRPIQSMGGDEIVVAAARVSTFGTDAVKFATDPAAKAEHTGLINYLMRHRHGTPFEHSAMTFFVHAPIFVWREWHRHRIGMSFNEESARYKQLDPVFWIPSPDRKIFPIEGFKSARPEFVPGTAEQYEVLVSSLKSAYTAAYHSYSGLLMLGFAREVVRACLPVGIYSSCWVTCNPRSLMHFLSLRVHDKSATFVSYPQAEIEFAAKATEDIFRQGWPITYEAFVNNGRVAP